MSNYKVTIPRVNDDRKKLNQHSQTLFTKAKKRRLHEKQIKTTPHQNNTESVRNYRQQELTPSNRKHSSRNPKKNRLRYKCSHLPSPLNQTRIEGVDIEIETRITRRKKIYHKTTRWKKKCKTTLHSMQMLSCQSSKSIIRVMIILRRKTKGELLCHQNHC